MNLSLLLSLCCQTGACSLCNTTDGSTLTSGIHMGGKRLTQSLSLGGHIAGVLCGNFLCQDNQLSEGWIWHFSLKVEGMFYCWWWLGFFFGRLQHNSPSHTICMCHFTKSPAILSVLSTGNSHICSLRAANSFSRD